jgi:hypothetical protein
MADERTYAEQMEAAREALRQGRSADAERLLGEALQTADRCYGAEHPSVATALAGLALVKRALGDDTAAEQLFRDALRIREKALAPQHMAIVVTMEQLSETCTARGNVREALTLLQRALPTREAALGADHATVRSLRTRIAELELQMLASAFASTAPQEQADVKEEPAVPASSISSEAVAPAPAPTAAGPYPAPSRRPRKKRIVFLTCLGIAAVAVVTGGMAARARADAAGVPAAVSSGVEAHPVADVATSAIGVTAPLPTTEAVLPDSVNQSGTGIVQAGAPMPDSATPAVPRAPRLPRAPKNLGAVTALVAAPNADSLVRASTKLDRGLTSDQLGPGVGSH